ncbi:hypothetical protein F4775DRAFT_281413 [Biscogniauxia sp. FL1348]|nr:hypothetical protein F4775DRAFT_281413 [Biscogniauxia sp. FL1348]
MRLKKNKLAAFCKSSTLRFSSKGRGERGGGQKKIVWQDYGIGIFFLLSIFLSTSLSTFEIRNIETKAFIYLFFILNSIIAAPLLEVV